MSPVFLIFNKGYNLQMENDTIKKYWHQFTSEHENYVDRNYSAWHFCDNERDANRLVELVKTGVKRGTASLKEDYIICKEPLPKVGKISIITDWNGAPQCIIETIKIHEVKFSEVTEELAAIEGEADSSLDYWRKSHMDFFSRICDEIGISFAEDLIVMFQEFKVIWK